jgi:hypothetical protein
MPLPKTFCFNGLSIAAAMRRYEKSPASCRIYKVESAAQTLLSASKLVTPY